MARGGRAARSPPPRLSTYAGRRVGGAHRPSSCFRVPLGARWVGRCDNFDRSGARSDGLQAIKPRGWPPLLTLGARCTFWMAKKRSGGRSTGSWVGSGGWWAFAARVWDQHGLDCPRRWLGGGGGGKGVGRRAWLNVTRCLPFLMVGPDGRVARFANYQGPRREGAEPVFGATACLPRPEIAACPLLFSLGGDPRNLPCRHNCLNG